MWTVTRSSGAGTQGGVVAPWIYMSWHFLILFTPPSPAAVELVASLQAKQSEMWVSVLDKTIRSTAERGQTKPRWNSCNVFILYKNIIKLKLTKLPELVLYWYWYCSKHLSRYLLLKFSKHYNNGVVVKTVLTETREYQDQDWTRPRLSAIVTKTKTNTSAQYTEIDTVHRYT